MLYGFDVWIILKLSDCGDLIWCVKCEGTNIWWVNGSPSRKGRLDVGQVKSKNDLGKVDVLISKEGLTLGNSKKGLRSVSSEKDWMLGK